MRRLLRRPAYLAVLLLWLLIMSFPIFAVFLAVQREIQIGESPRSHLRIFLIQERQAEGVGVEWTRQSPDRENCAETSLAYLMWEGESENVTFCQCYDEEGSVILSEPGECSEV